nr:FtsK/SpoIIIE domain-containing protein [Streptococcus anginosus]
KGGAAFGALTQLPHTAGVLTDLDPALTTRALASLEAEVRRRESLLADLGVADLAAWEAMASPTAVPEEQPGGTAGERFLAGSGAPGPPPPRVVIAVDEFATLASAHPQVLDTLVRVAAQGRSLGLHLVLATQRPSGAVSQTVR